MAEANDMNVRDNRRGLSPLQDVSLQSQASTADTLEVGAGGRTGSHEQRALRPGGTVSSNVQPSGSALSVRQHELEMREMVDRYKETEHEIDLLFSPAENKMSQEPSIDKIVEQINEPQPTDSPLFGILKKRKLGDQPEDGIIPARKRKRIRFSEPEVILYMDDQLWHTDNPNSEFVDLNPQESLVTGSIKNETTDLTQDEPTPIVNESVSVHIKSQQVCCISSESESGSVEIQSEPVPRNMLTASPSTATNSHDETVRQLEEENENEDVLNELFGTVCSKMNSTHL